MRRGEELKSTNQNAEQVLKVVIMDIRKFFTAATGNAHSDASEKQTETRYRTRTSYLKTPFFSFSFLLISIPRSPSATHTQHLPPVRPLPPHTPLPSTAAVLVNGLRTTALPVKWATSN